MYEIFISYSITITIVFISFFIYNYYNDKYKKIGKIITKYYDNEYIIYIVCYYYEIDGSQKQDIKKIKVLKNKYKELDINDNIFI